MRNRMNLGWFAAIVTLTAAAPAHGADGGWMSGNDLLDLCTTQEPAKAGRCLGYITGIVDFSGSSQVEANLKYGPLTTPPGVTAGQLRDIVVKYMKENPKYNHLVAADLVFIAIKRAFPR